MPFTLSHPAAVLPLRRTRLIFSALVIGSMAPDIEYFFGFTRPVSHSFPGVITFTFPLAAAVLVLFHLLIKWPAISLMPRALQVRLVVPARQFRWRPRRMLLSAVSLAIGIASHIVLDAFTHADGWPVRHWPALAGLVSVSPHRHAHVYSLLQFAATALGVAVLMVAFAVWYRRAPQDSDLPRRLAPAISWTILIVMVVSAVAIGLLRGSEVPAALLHGVSHRMQFIVGFVITSITVAGIELFGFSLIWRMFLSQDVVPGAVHLRDRRYE